MALIVSSLWMRDAIRVCWAAVIALTVACPSFADQAACNKVSKQAEKDQVFFSPPGAFDVVGDGRLYFYLAPHEGCKSKDVFVIPGDSLFGYTEYKGWYSVYYINPKTGKEVDGWVDGKRLKFTGTIGLKN